MRTVTRMVVVAVMLAGAVGAGRAAPVVRIAVDGDAPACVQFGAQDLRAALEASGQKAEVAAGAEEADVRIGTAQESWAAVAPPEPAESFAIARQGGTLLIVGRDAVGAMYGALDAAEQVRWAGPGARLQEAVAAKSESPFVPLRGVNPFISVQAMQDPNSWFYSEDYWRGYLDLLARSRINWLDLHAMYDLVTTGFPNLFCFFVESDRFPGVTIPAEEKAKNLAMLQRIFEMAHDRGIKTGVMNYHARWHVTGYQDPPHEMSEENLTAFARECSAKLIKACPDLDVFGFRIGESGKKELFFTSYLDGVRDSGRKDILVYTRSWAANPDSVKELASLSPLPFLIEIKYNGEQLGLPYHVLGNRMAGKGSYSFQTYTDRPRDYRIIWQVRTNGTHRIFRWGNPEFVRRNVRTFGFSEAPGYTMETMTSYYPQRMAQVLSPSMTTWCDWMWERNWFWYTLWGRLSYNPDAPTRIWEHEFARRFGSAGPAVERVITASSRIVPFLYGTYSFSPDHRGTAIEFENCGDINTFVKTEAFDDSVFASVKEYVDTLVEGGATGKYTPPEVAAFLGECVRQTREAIEEADRATARAGLGDAALADYRAAKMDAEAVCWLGEYHRAKRLAAADYELYRRVGGEQRKESALRGVRYARYCWRKLSDVQAAHYGTVLERLRMKTTEFAWASQLPRLRRDVVLVNTAKPGTETLPPRDGSDMAKPVIHNLQVKWTHPAPRATVTVNVHDESGVARVILWHRPMPSENTWVATEMAGAAGEYVATMPVTPQGALYRIEAHDRAGNGAQYPDVMKEIPYRYIDSWDPSSP